MTAEFLWLRLLDLCAFFALLAFGAHFEMPYLAAAWALGMLWRALVGWEAVD